MQAIALLGEVSEAYRGLRTLSLEALLTDESGDENASQRGERRMTFAYAAPNRMRFEFRGGPGTLQVSDGTLMHTCFGRLRLDPSGGGKHYTSTPIAEFPRIPHCFQPDFPFGSGAEAFLFPGIHERVTAAEILREEDGCFVVSVSYEPPPRPGVIVVRQPILFWVNAWNRMIMRHQGEMGFREPTQDEVDFWTRHTSIARNMRVNQPIPEETFHFTPPPDAIPEEPRACGISVSGGSSFISHDADENRRLEHSGSHEWQDATLVEHSRWKIRGMTLTFERRLTFSEDGRELRVDERASGPQADVQTSCKLPLG